MEAPLYILVAGTTNEAVSQARGGFPDWIRTAVGDEWQGPWSLHDLREELPFPDPTQAAGFIITGSSASVTERAAWMLRAEGFIRDIVKASIPLFGVCFGHQLMAQALGGHVDKNPRGREIGTACVTTLEADPIFEGLEAEFFAHATHVDTVTRVPPLARVLARSGGDDAAVIAYDRVTKSVQFHPEFDSDVIRRYIQLRRDLIESEGLDADALHRDVRESVDGYRTLRNFVRHVVQTRPRAPSRV